MCEPDEEYADQLKRENVIEKYMAGDNRNSRHQCELLAGGVMVRRRE